MKKRGFIWISAVLYIALGIVAISLVMTAGLPLINKMKERNTVLQTKDVMHAIDKNIWQVRSEGVGSRRFLEPIIIKGGNLMIYDKDASDDSNKIIWQMKTKAKMMEACEAGESDEEELETCTQTEGNLRMYSYFTKIEGEYLISLVLDYSKNMDLDIDESTYISGSALTGKYGLGIENKGKKAGEDKGTILLTIK